MFILLQWHDNPALIRDKIEESCCKQLLKALFTKYSCSFISSSPIDLSLISNPSVLPCHPSPRNRVIALYSLWPELTVFSIAFLMVCVGVNQFLLLFYSLNAMLFIAEKSNPNMQHYSSKTKSPLNTSGSHQSTSIHRLNFNSDIKIISAAFV